MKKLLLPAVLAMLSLSASGQTFWTENFTGGSTGLQVGSYTSTNGAWSNNVLSTEGASPNIWYVSCTEAGKTAGTCGAACATGDFGESLHLGSNSVVGGDLGAAYFTGGCTTYTSYYGYTYSYGTCAATDRRAESPVINCTGKSSISLSYYYIENGDVTTDNGTVYYYDGSGWSLLEDPPKTPTCSGSQGKWAKRTVALPSSANNNPNIKIGFRWVNDEDGMGSDPSFAVDSVSLSSSAVAPVASFTASKTTICQDSCITFTSTSTGTMDSLNWHVIVSGFPVYIGHGNPLNLCFPSTYIPAGTYTMQLKAFNGTAVDSSSTSITINTAPHPAVTKSGKVLSVAGTHVSYQWYNAAGKISGATSSTYTYTAGGTYSVIVDSGGCKGTGTITVAGVGVSQVQHTAANYWVSQTNGSISLHANEADDEQVYITVFSTEGRQVANDILAAGSTQKDINASSLPTGVYTIRLSNSKMSEAIKFLKQ